MSASHAIQVESLSKQYRLGEGTGSSLLRDTLAGWIRAPFRRRIPAAPPSSEVLWALRDVAFAIRPGEAVGIIGRNGSGKSTLLKLISRITEPTTGRIRLRGRVASLLEVGTGFHPDLTGRENIYLNGAILGMTRPEIRRKFDEIVAFAGLEQFIETPVRRYSSGMSVRLAFAVAAHLEPEILLLDEVLAVGDADFQRKCLRKMSEVTQQEGRTILFVSHQLPSVQQLCDRVIVLNRGRVTHDTDAASGIAAYLATTAEAEPSVVGLTLGPELVLEEYGITPTPPRVFDDPRLVLAVRAVESCTLHDLCLIFTNQHGQRIAIADLRQAAASYQLARGDVLRVEGELRRIGFVPGTYSVTLYVRTNTHVSDRHMLTTLEVQPQPSTGLMSYPAEDQGTLALDVRFAVTLNQQPWTAPAR
jgi:lipopolysaccharide transport system ATP-binding protein